MNIVIIGVKPSSLRNFRGELLKKLSLNDMHKIYAMASNATDTEINSIIELGANYIDYPVTRSGLSPISDFKTFKVLRSIFKKKKPNVILAYTIKPIIWGGIAARVLPHCRFYALVTGLGFAFQKGSWKKNLLVKLVTFLYKIALKKADKVIFQNPDNQQVFIGLGIVAKHKTCVVNGSGVDVAHFDVKPLPSAPRFLLIARLLGDKGIREYIAAANKVKEQYTDAVFQLVGPEDPSPNGISLTELSILNNKKSVEYLGSTNDVRPYIEGSSIFVLPSYHEGLPRTVLEAMATGRPILTTDAPGCRETVINDVNGWLVEKANVEQLAERMIWFIENQSDWQRMGEASRTMVEDKFDVHKVNENLLSIMELVN
ncbi:glycosyl transferase family 1 [Vibrio toranzoniae]|uniref:Glycosyl transferase family 1 n=1 Tax=Vibrio toranzoniae TaxID=1194427 RepID=A0A109DBR7_9VIBR|nr:glycosyltransferase family 4 protein [Vibrio toranzoniae]KWU02528.1 glycosyl transferase family 1 [Vibrio toranzoniae]SBS37146.1 N, N'-diacetylbacillosaminyl-diphospho-undecaprenol alpha-1,3-N-acetylgalactosaminyltransferase [Vibrio toranzoniae]